MLAKDCDPSVQVGAGGMLYHPHSSKAVVVYLSVTDVPWFLRTVSQQPAIPSPNPSNVVWRAGVQSDFLSEYFVIQNYMRIYLVQYLKINK